MFVNLLSKIFVALFLVLADLVRLGKWTFNGFKGNNSTPEQPTGEPITRSEFLTKAALVAGAVPAVAMTFGILSGAHDYRVRRVTVRLPNLPKSFDGLRLAQISDIHSGSFFNKTAVKGGVEMLLREKPDLVFFTGDLVNNVATEVQDYISIFNKVKAPLGVYSTLGNHDYGDYVSWATPQAKRQNLQDLMTAHKLLGWDLLMNENRKLKRGGDEIAIVGIENWGGKGRFPKYGRLDLANKNTQDSAVKLLLSHDPSHWRAQVLEEYPDIDVMFAGHTHGMQFGVELGNVKWSPVKVHVPRMGRPVFRREPTPVRKPGLRLHRLSRPHWHSARNHHHGIQNGRVTASLQAPNGVTRQCIRGLIPEV
jgi:predicted MPP superfamily phosphohydrolase